MFEQNAWDDVEVRGASGRGGARGGPCGGAQMDAEMKAAAMEKLRLQRANAVPEGDRAGYNARAGELWDQFYGVHAHRFFKDRAWLFTEFPELAADGALTLLEVGCGAGNTVFPLLQTNRHPDLLIHACDVSATAVELVRGHAEYAGGRCNAFVCNVASEPLPLPADSVDLVGLWRGGSGGCGLRAGAADYLHLCHLGRASRPDAVRRAGGEAASAGRACAPVRLRCPAIQAARCLRPGGRILLRDYGRHDLTQLRLKGGRLLAENFYIRGDGTQVYFFRCAAAGPGAVPRP